MVGLTMWKEKVRMTAKHVKHFLKWKAELPMGKPNNA